MSARALSFSTARQALRSVVDRALAGEPQTIVTEDGGRVVVVAEAAWRSGSGHGDRTGETLSFGGFLAAFGRRDDTPGDSGEDLLAEVRRSLWSRPAGQDFADDRDA